jgi:hypothetical protein
MKLLNSLIAFCFIALPSARAAEIRFNHEGLLIDAGSMGQFKLEFPELLGDDPRIQKYAIAG